MAWGVALVTEGSSRGENSIPTRHSPQPAAHRLLTIVRTGLAANPSDNGLGQGGHRAATALFCPTREGSIRKKGRF